MPTSPPIPPAAGQRSDALMPLASLTVLAAFAIVAAFAALLPGFVVDRHATQLLPIMRIVTDEPLAGALARTAQAVIVVVELAGGLLLLAALAAPRRRRFLAAIACTALTGLFGIFLLVIFMLHHDPRVTLPHWSQYVPILIWIQATWHLVVRMPAPEPS